MQRAKTFFYVSLGILALAAAFHLGALRAEGQAAGTLTAFADGGGGLWAGNSNGGLWNTISFSRFSSCISSMRPSWI